MSLTSHRCFVIAALCAALSFYGCTDPLPESGALERARVVKVRDGDSLVVDVAGQTIEVRLHGIDAPERGQPHGDVAREALVVLTRSGGITLDRRAVDRYQRQVAVVTAADSTKSINQLMIEQGHAWHYPRYDQNATWAAAQRRAREARRGLWAAPKSTPPWEWRRR